MTVLCDMFCGHTWWPPADPRPPDHPARERLTTSRRASAHTQPAPGDYPLKACRRILDTPDDI